MDRGGAVLVDLDHRAAAGSRALDPRAGGEADALVLLQLDLAPADFFLGDTQGLRQGAVAQLGNADDAVALLGHVLQAELDGVHAQFGGEGVHVGFHRKGGLGAAGTAHRTAYLFVGVDGEAVHVDVGQAVPAAHHLGAAAAGLVAEARVAAGVVHHLALARHQGAVLLDAALDPDLAARADGGGDGLFRLVHDDHHRLLGGQRQERADGLQAGAGGDSAALAAEAAADVRGDDAYAVQGQSHQVGDFGAHRERRLGVGPDREAAVLLGPGRGDARLQVLGVDHLRFVDFVYYHVGFRHGGLGVADVHRHVAADVLDLDVFRQVLRQRHVLVDGRRRLLHGLFQIHHHRQRLVSDLDLLEGLLDQRQAVRRHRRHRVAHVADLVLGEDVAVDVGPAVAHVRRIRRRHHGAHAGDGLGRAGVDADDLRMGVLAPEHAAVERVGQVQVDAVDALSDHPLHPALAGHVGSQDRVFRLCHGS